MTSVKPAASRSELPEAVTPPLALHPDNPHYFLFRGEPTVLISSAEHYGAVLNLDFDYVTYLEELKSRRLNHTRIFSGAYLEQTGTFNLSGNTLAPARDRFICPWPRSTTPCCHLGGNQFDLAKRDEAYYERLKDFIREGSGRGIVVEMVLFCTIYDEEVWKLSPQNASNNINALRTIPHTDVYTLDQNGGLLPFQEALVRNIVTELREFDNVYYEICNEPYVGNVAMEWQHRIADLIVETEKDFSGKHLIAQNIANGSEKVRQPHPAISIFNFHYASPPTAVAENYALNKVISDDETGFKGIANAPYRMEAWEFILAGGGLYSNLDLSFSVGHERGDYAYPESQPAGGNPEFRGEMTVLRDFINSFDFIRMKPGKAVVADGLSKKTRVHVLAEAGRQYALYIYGGDSVTLFLEIPAGQYRATWINPLTGKEEKQESVTHGKGALKLASPFHAGEIALRMVRE